MIGFLIALGAGFVVPHLDGPVATPVAGFLRKHFEVEDAELRVISFAVAMLGAGLAATLFNSSNPFWVIIAGVLGYFLLRIVGAAKGAMDNRRGE